MRRIESKVPWRCILGRRSRCERPIGLQIKRRGHGARQRPLPLVAPAATVVQFAQRGLAATAATHHENAHRGLGAGLPRGVVRQPAVEERKLLLEVTLHTPHALRTKVNLVAVAGVAPHADMAPGADHQPLRGAVLGRHGREVLGVGGRERVVPAGRQGGRYVGVLAPVPGVVVLDAVPVGVVAAPGVIVDQRVLQRGHMAQCGLPALPGRGAKQLAQVAQVVPDVLLLARVIGDLAGVLGMDEQRPEHVLLHRAAFAALVLVAVGGHHIGPDGSQVRRAFQRGAHLGDRGVGAANRADASVRPWLPGYPFADVVTIAAGMRRGGMEILPRRLGAVAVAQVDQHHVVAPGHKEVGDLAVALVRLVVWRVQHDRRETALGEGPLQRRAVDVEGQPHTIAHGDHDVFRQHNAVPCPLICLSHLPLLGVRQ